MAWYLRTLAALAEDPGGVPGNYMAIYNYPKPCF